MIVRTLLQVSPPPVPASRPYTVAGNHRIAFPHSRVVRTQHTSKYSPPVSVRPAQPLILAEDGQTVSPGDLVTVLGVANVRGHLVVGFGLGRFGTLPYSVLQVGPDIC